MTTPYKSLRAHLASLIRTAPASALTLSILMPFAHAAAAPEHIVVPGERLFTESLTSTSDGSVIIGSVGARTIFRASPGSAKAESWIQPGTDGMQSVFGVFADDKSNSLWVCSNALAPPGTPPSAPGSLYVFDLKSGQSKGHYPLPTAGAFCNDIAVDQDGTAYATDTNNMEVVRLQKGAKQVEVWAGNEAFGPKGGVLDGISVLGNRVLVNTLRTSKLFSVPIESSGKAGTVTEVKLDRAIERPDGMRSHGKDSLLVTEGGSGGRLSLITLTGETGKVSTLKEGFPDGPVAVTVVGSTAYVLEGQLAAMRGPPDPNAKPKPFQATAVAITAK